MIGFHVVFTIPNTDDCFIQPISTSMRRMILEQMRLPPDQRRSLEVINTADDTVMIVDMSRVVVLHIWEVEP